MSRLIAAVIMGAALVVTACTTTGEMEGQRIRGTASPPTQEAFATDLHADAPQWFKETWRRYLELSDGNYGVMAADRNGRGAGYVYCDPGSGGLCKSHHKWSATFKDVNYKRRALNFCVQHVRENYPALKPDCALYAITDKIVWKGPMPWSVAAATRQDTRAATSLKSKGNAEQRTFTLSWVGSTDVYRGIMTYQQGNNLGRMSTTMAGRDCEGQFQFTSGRRGQWEIDCSDGWISASGEFTATGGPNGGSRGTGVDNEGRMVEFVVDPAGGS